MSFREDVREAIQDPEIDENWDQMIESMIDSEDRQQELLEWVEEYRNEFLEMAEDVKDDEEIKTSLVLRYIEIKCHWTMLNTHMQYQAVNTGKPDQEIALKGSLISQLLERMEELLDEEYIEQITEFLSKPMDKLSGDELP